jgi:hypothetical protein
LQINPNQPYTLFNYGIKAILNIANSINMHPADHPLSVLIKYLLNDFIDKISKVNRKKVVFVVNQFFKRTKYPMFIYIEADLIY